ncbi:MAG: DUF4286 family protein [Saprospiraceae bacterium]|nr:DUF4286 family protein [Saprospiraceae bacterium]
MVVYNVTVKLNSGIHEEWLQWMRSHHIPRVLSTGIFNKCRLSRLDVEETDGVTYVIQYDAPSMEAMNKYMAQYAPALQKEHIDKYANQFVAFRTYLKVIEEIYPTERKS